MTTPRESQFSARQEFDEEMARLGVGVSWDNGKCFVTFFPEQKTFLLRGGNHLAHVVVERTGE